MLFLDPSVLNLPMIVPGHGWIGRNKYLKTLKFQHPTESNISCFFFSFSTERFPYFYLLGIAKRFEAKSPSNCHFESRFD